MFAFLVKLNFLCNIIFKYSINPVLTELSLVCLSVVLLLAHIPTITNELVFLLWVIDFVNLNLFLVSPGAYHQVA